MNSKLLRDLEGDIPLLTQSQLKFLDDVKLVVEERLGDDGLIDAQEDEEKIFEIMAQVETIEENLRTIISRLKGGRSARRKFLNTYPKWRKVREDGIKKLREIAQSIETDRFNCNVSKLVGYSASFIGGAITLTSAILIPFTFGLTTPLAIGGGSMTAAGCSTVIGTTVTEAVRLNNKVKEAQEVIDKDKEYFQEMNNWMEHAAKLQEALSEIMEIDIVKDIVENVKSLVAKCGKMKDDFTRLNTIEREVNGIIALLPLGLTGAVNVIAIITIISVLVAVFLMLLNTENRYVFDCASLTIRSIVGIASLADDAFDVARVARLFTSNAALATDIAKATTRGAVAVLGMGLDVAGIALTSIDIHKGSHSPVAEQFAKASDDMEEEATILQNVYENINDYS